MKAMPNDCELCEAARITPWYHEDDFCWVAECEVCSVPMVVWREHNPSPSDDVRVALHSQLAAVMTAEFPDVEYVLDDNLRSIPNHYHAHARPRRRVLGTYAGQIVIADDFDETPAEVLDGLSDPIEP
jgi:hypothetical protein